MKTKHLYLILFLLFPFTWIQCSGESLIDPNANGNADAGMIVVLGVHHLSDGSALPAEADGHKALVNDLGYDLHLEEALVNWRSLRLISAGEDPECEPGHDQDIPLNRVENVLGEDLVESLLVQAAVPLVSYCRFEVTLAPTPAGSAQKFHEGEAHGSEAGVGIDVSYHLVGTWSKDAGSGDFELMGSEEVKIEGEFQAEEGEEIISHPLHFHEGETEVQWILSLHYDQVFAGMDFAVDSPDALRFKLLNNLLESVHQHTGGHP